MNQIGSVSALIEARCNSACSFAGARFISSERHARDTAAEDQDTLNVSHRDRRSAG
jgi:hypothetical protein